MNRFWRFFFSKIANARKFFSGLFLARAFTSKTHFGAHFRAREFQNELKKGLWRRKSKYNHENHWATFPDSVNRVKFRNTFLVKKKLGRARLEKILFGFEKKLFQKKIQFLKKKNCIFSTKTNVFCPFLKEKNVFFHFFFF